MGYYRGDYYRGDPGVLDTLRQTFSSGFEQDRFPSFGQPVKTRPGRIITPEEPGDSGGMQRPGHVLGERAGTGYDRRRRRMNPLNPRALRRSMRRVQSFARFASKTMSFVKRHKMKKHRRR